jgi:hypothetical protein
MGRNGTVKLDLVLYWYRTRYLDPIAGRFTTRDTIGIWGETVWHPCMAEG